MNRLESKYGRKNRLLKHVLYFFCSERGKKSMTIGKHNITEAVTKITAMLESDKKISAELKAMIEVLLLIIQLLVAKTGLNSSNSSKPPSSDPNRNKNKNTSSKDEKRKPGGQIGHVGSSLTLVDNPNETQIITVDRSTIPSGEYKVVGYEKRQLIEVIISKHVIEYQAEILQNKDGKQFVAKFPEGVNQPAQYGSSVRAHATYLSQSQMLPINRVQEYFHDQAGISLSQGFIVYNNQRTYDQLEVFENWLKKELANEPVLHADETGINVDKKRVWLHSVSSPLLTYFYPHQKRGMEAMIEAGVLENFTNILVHDHWKPYYNLNCLHGLCNAHHLRELQWSIEFEKQEWAQKMKDFLETLNKEVNENGGLLPPELISQRINEYEIILDQGDTESPPAVKEEGKRGKVKNTKSRNLLVRLRKYRQDVLRFMENIDVPFTNNQGERDLRMTKVQQKISGCFKSMDQGAKVFCRIRSYLSTCSKRNVTASTALEMLAEGKLPDFVKI